MALFGAIQTSGSGLTVFRTWMDAISDNIANLNTVRSTDGEAFRARYVVARSKGSGAEAVSGAPAGSEVAGVELGDPEGRLVYQPDHPLADEDGMVRYPSTDLGDQMTQLLVAQRGYQANLAVVDRVRDAYLQALQIGK
jgi:flagellar basal-body rod protein FlgC